MEFPENMNSESRELYNASTSKFNFEALQRVATEYRRIYYVGCEAIAQGGYNTVSKKILIDQCIWCSFISTRCSF